jgi:hypothetical protein
MTIKNSQNLSASELIVRLNPIIKRWSNYFSLGQSIHMLYRIDNFLYTRIKIWLIKKFSKTSRRVLYRNYFGTELDLKTKKEEYSTREWINLINEDKVIPTSPIGVKWHFRGSVTNGKTYIKTKTVWLTIASKLNYIIPPQLVILKNYCKFLNYYSNKEIYAKQATVIHKQRKIIPLSNPTKKNL